MSLLILMTDETDQHTNRRTDDTLAEIITPSCISAMNYDNNYL